MPLQTARTGDLTVDHNFLLLTQAVTAAPEPVHYIGNTGEPAFENSWVNNDAGTPGSGTGRYAYFYKDHGRVYLGGVIKSGASGTTAFTLPPGHFPHASGVLIQLATNASGGTAAIAVTPAGAVQPLNMTGTAVTTFVFLEVDFRARA